MNKLLAAFNGTYVHNGCAPTANAGAGLKVDVAKGYVLVGNTVYQVAAATVTLDAADGSNPRKDLIVYTVGTGLTFTKGTAAAAKEAADVGPETYEPLPPAIPANSIVLAEVWVATADAGPLDAADVTDRRVIHVLYAPQRMRARMDRYCISHCDGVYMGLKAYAAQGAIGSWIDSIYLTFGVYQVVAKTCADAALCAFNDFVMPFILETHHGFPPDGLMCFMKGMAAAVYNQSWSETAGGSEVGDLGAQDWTADTTFKIDWDNTPRARFYIGGALITTHTVRVPITPVAFGFECAHSEFYPAINSTEQGTTSTLFVYAKDMTYL
jgi:hypothetical protein